MNLEDNNQSIVLKTGVDRMDDENKIEIGNWYLIDTSDDSLFYCTSNGWNKNEITSGEHSTLVCADRFESNLVILRSNASEYRVLTKNMDKLLKPVSEIDSLMMVEDALAGKRVTINQLQQQIKSIIQQLNPKNGNTSDSTDVMIATKDALVAKNTELKEVHGKQINKLGEEIKSHVADLTDIARYITLPASVNMNQIAESREVIDEKIHDLAIYGGLYEQENTISEGYSARDDQPIHIYQNLKFMDVECIDAYITGGINANNIGKFDKWIAEPENRDRVLPQPKSIVAIKNRKYPKRSGWSNDPNEIYLYMRNGDNIKRLKTAVDIKKTLLATDNVMGAEPYVKIDNHRKNEFKFITENEYQEREKTIRLFKPLYISSLLESHRVEKRYLDMLISYAQGRKNNAQAVLLKGEDKPQAVEHASDDDFESGIGHLNDHLQINKESTNELQGLIEKILSEENIQSVDIHTDITRPAAHSMSLRTYTSGLRISDDELGYLTESGEEVLLSTQVPEYQDELRAVTREYMSISAHHGVTKDSEIYNPFSHERDLKEYGLINDDNFFFDSIKKNQWKNYKRQNELAVLIQGLIDRTSFFGYIEANLFKPGFEENIKLVYDEKLGIYSGEMPDFKAFISQCNEYSKVGDFFYGQAEVWAALEAEKRESYRDSGHSYHYETTHIPELLAASKIVKKRSGKTVVVFKWEVARDWWSQAKTKYKTHTFECNLDLLINVSHYNQGDYKQFAEDPRCRALYPKWGAILMSAEHHKNKDSGPTSDKD